MSGYLSGLLALLCINIVFAYGVFLPVATGQLNLGGAGFQALGAYMAAYLSTAYELPPIVTLPLAALIGGVVGCVIAFPVLRTRGAYMVLATIAFAEVVTGAILTSQTLGGATGLSVDSYVGLNVIVPITACVVLGVFYLMGTRLGLAMRGVHDDETVADLMGVSVRAVQVFSFAMGGALIGLSGGLYAHQLGFVSAQNFSVDVSVNVLLFVLLGGTQTAWGPLVGTVVFTLLPEVMRSALPALATAVSHLVGSLGLSGGRPDESWRFVVLGVFTVGMMMLRPEGIVTRTMTDRLRLRRPRRVTA